MKMTATTNAAAAAMGFKPVEADLDGFAEAVYNGNSFDEVKNCRTVEADEADMTEWGIDADEWRAAQVKAIEHAMFMHDLAA